VGATAISQGLGGLHKSSAGSQPESMLTKRKGSEASRMSECWRKYHSKRHNRAHWYNIMTGETSWADPTTQNILPSAANTTVQPTIMDTSFETNVSSLESLEHSVSQTSIVAVLPEGWIMHWSKKYNQTYWYNSNTHASQWVNPVAGMGQLFSVEMLYYSHITYRAFFTAKQV
jgi:hypothetical protein